MSGPSRPELPAGTRREILEALLREELGAADLADRLGISPAAVRQHLAPLRGVGLVERRKAEPAGGRPTYLYRLSLLGQRAFPKRYDLLLAEIVEALLERHGSEAVLEVVTDAARRLARRVEGRFIEAGPEERWDAVLAWIEEEFGWEAQLRASAAGDHEIVLHHCPFLAISADHPAVCGRFFTTLLGILTGETRIEHVPIRDGFRCCALKVG